MFRVKSTPLIVPFRYTSAEPLISTSSNEGEEAITFKRRSPLRILIPFLIFTCNTPFAVDTSSKSTKLSEPYIEISVLEPLLCRYSTSVLPSTLIELKLLTLFNSFVIYFLLGVTVCACIPVINKNISTANIDVTFKLFIIFFVKCSNDKYKKYISIYKKRTNITLPTFRINAEQ